MSPRNTPPSWCCQPKWNISPICSSLLMLSIHMKHLPDTLLSHLDGVDPHVKSPRYTSPSWCWQPKCNIFLIYCSLERFLKNQYFFSSLFKLVTWQKNICDPIWGLQEENAYILPDLNIGDNWLIDNIKTRTLKYWKQHSGLHRTGGGCGTRKEKQEPTNVEEHTGHWLRSGHEAGEISHESFGRATMRVMFRKGPST